VTDDNVRVVSNIELELSSPHEMAKVLLLGGHGKVALRITKLLAAQNHHVVSVIRNAEHIADIRALAPSHNIQLVEPVLASVEDADDEVAARMMKDIDWVVWSAGSYFLCGHLHAHDKPICFSQVREERAVQNARKPSMNLPRNDS